MCAVIWKGVKCKCVMVCSEEAVSGRDSQNKGVLYDHQEEKECVLYV